MFKKSIIIGLLATLIFIACPNEITQEPIPEPAPDGKTYLKIENKTQYAVNVYINDPPFYDAPAETLRHVTAWGSEQWELQPTEEGKNGETLYFEYLIPIGNVVIPYYPNDTDYIKIQKLEKGMINTKEVPSLGSAKSDSIFILIKNNSNDTVWFQQSFMTLYPRGSSVRDILPGSDAVFVFSPINTSLNNCTIGNLTRHNFPATTLEKGKVYTYIYDGKTAPSLFLVEHFDPAMAKNVWCIPTSTVYNRSLTVGYFSPRQNPANGYIMLGNINKDNYYAYDGNIKSSPYFAHIARDGSIIEERIIPFPNSKNQYLIASILEDAGKYIFLGQMLHNGENTPFIGSFNSNFVPNYYYDGFDSDIETDTEILNTWSDGKLVRIGNGKYGILCNIENKDGGLTAYLAIVTETTFDEVEHHELWRSSMFGNSEFMNMMYDEAHNMFIVIVYENDPDENCVIFFIDAVNGSEKFPRITQNKFYYEKIIKIGNNYYVAGGYENMFGKTEGVLDKLDPATGQLEWKTDPKRFPSVDGSGSLTIWNLFEDNDKLILSGVSNVTHGNTENCKPWLCAYDITTGQNIWEQCYDDPKYNNYVVYSAYSNGIGSYILELCSYESLQSLLVSTDLMGRISYGREEPIPRNPDMVVTTPTYTVTYNINGGTGIAPAKDTIAAGHGVILAGGYGFSKNGYVFDGWNTNSIGTGTSYTALSFFLPTDNIILYAKWTVPILSTP